MTLEELTAKACLLPLRFEPGDAENTAAITNEDGVVIFVEGDAPDDEREATAALMVHCVNNFAQVADALREALTQLDYYNAETRETSRWAEWYLHLRPRPKSKPLSRKTLAWATCLARCLTTSQQLPPSSTPPPARCKVI